MIGGISQFSTGLETAPELWDAKAGQSTGRNLSEPLYVVLSSKNTADREVCMIFLIKDIVTLREKNYAKQGDKAYGK